MTLVLAGAYAGWAGSLPAEVVDERLQQALRLADLPPDRLVDELLPTLFRASAPAELVEEFAASMSEFRPAGLRANARAFAETDLREVLPRIAVPTLLLHGAEDVRAPLNVAQDLPRRHSRIEARDPGGSGSRVPRGSRRPLRCRGAGLPASSRS